MPRGTLSKPFKVFLTNPIRILNISLLMADRQMERYALKAVANRYLSLYQSILK